ncbi:hypothetical protein K501DRAFT_240053 [Backusella circina FSU 941]|nr:hypothetical protein K501DRAFT_240053 [Backusella circina FSU 941]
MASHSPHPDSLSPHTSKGPVSAFQWPIPPSSHTKPSELPDITVKEILDKYQDDPELLKYILSAKSEEDRKRAAKDTLKAEEARIQLKQMDLDLAREQTKAHTRYERPQPPPPMQYGYYSLAPVQQQVLARFQQQQHHPYRPPPSPAGYPHSAHPLCPPTSVDYARLYHRQTSPISPSVTDPKRSLKRNRMSISNDTEDKLSHNKVMEALKAKIQRGGGPMSPLAPPTPREPLEKKKKTSTPTTATTETASPRSAKPYLPPIDTKLGRVDHEESDNSSSSSSNSSSESDNEKKKRVGSPSDPILVNARRARSLSPSSAKKS